MVPSATTELVEELLDKHGDPATDSGESSASEAADPSDTPDDKPEPSDNEDAHGNRNDDATTPETGRQGSETTATDEYPSADALSVKQRETLRVIAEQPDATQAEVAEQLGVSAPTVSNRVNSVDGFDWAQREAFVAAVFGTDAADSGSGDEAPSPGGMTADGGTASSDEPESEETPPADGTAAAEATVSGTELQRLDDRLSGLEEQLDAIEAEREEPDSALADPELLHKVVHACLESETITEEEELRIIQSLMR